MTQEKVLITVRKSPKPAESRLKSIPVCENKNQLDYCMLVVLLVFEKGLPKQHC